MTTDKLDMRGLTLTVRLKSKVLNGLVDGLLRHRPIRRPLSSSDRQQARLRDVDHVVSDERLGVLCPGVSDQRSDPRPRREHISSADFDVGREVVANWKTPTRYSASDWHQEGGERSWG